MLYLQHYYFSHVAAQILYLGAVYVYSLGDDGNWGLQQKLVPTNTDSTANKFGNAVATSGNVLVVGADLDDSQGADSGKCFMNYYSFSQPLP